MLILGRKPENKHEPAEDKRFSLAYLQHMTLTFFLIGAAGLLVLLAMPAGAQTFRADQQVIYVPLGGEKHLAVFDFDNDTGAMTPRSRVGLAGEPGAMTLDAARKTLYVGLGDVQSVQALRLGGDGTPTPLAVTPMGLNPVYLALDPAGTHLLAADYGSGEVVSFPVLKNGAVGEPATQRFTAGKNPHSFYFDPSGKFAFVPVLGDDAIMQYRYDAAAGTLSPNGPRKVMAQKGDGPRHLAWHPNGEIVLCADETSCTLTSYRFDPASGTLTTLDRASSLPPGYAGKNLSTADVHLTRDGRFAYISNRGHDSLAGFAVDPKTGKLTPIGHYATEATPRAFSFDATGKFVIAAGQGSGKLAVYRLDAASGKLDRVQTVEAGEGPAWVEAVDIGNSGGR